MNWAGWVLVIYFAINIVVTAARAGVAAQKEPGSAGIAFVAWVIYTAFTVGLIALTFHAAQG